MTNFSFNHTVSRRLIQAIDQAQQQIILTGNWVFNPTLQLALIEASRRQVNIQVVLDSTQSQRPEIAFLNQFQISVQFAQDFAREGIIIDHHRAFWGYCSFSATTSAYLVELTESNFIKLYSDLIKQFISCSDISFTPANTTDILDLSNQKLNTLILSCKLLSYENDTLQMMIQEVESIIYLFNARVHLATADLQVELLQRKARLAELRAALTQKPEDKAVYEFAKQQYHQYQSQTHESRRIIEAADLSENEAALLKKYFREASQLAHPDLFQNADPDLKLQAENIQKEINQAYQTRNLKRLQEILEALKNGMTLVSKSSVRSGQERLKFFEEKFSKLITERQGLHQTLLTKLIESTFELATNQQDFENYVRKLREQLHYEIEIINRDITHLEAVINSI